MEVQLRAGPLGSSSSSHVEYGASAVSSSVPINAADVVDNLEWPWKYYVETYRAFGVSTEITTREYEDGFVDESVIASTSGGSAGAYLETRWRYQAALSHNFAVSYDLTSQVTSGSGVDGTYVSLEIWVDGVKEVDLIAGDPSSSPGASVETLSGSTTISLPDTVESTPKLVIIRAEGSISETGAADTEVDLNISIT